MSAVAFSIGGSHAVHAGSPPSAPPITVTPTTVSDGTPFTVSGAGCVDPDTQSGEGLIAIVLAPGLYYPYDGELSGTLFDYVDVEDDGTWQIDTMAETRESYWGARDDFDTALTVYCSTSRTWTDAFFAYESVEMRYLGQQIEPTTTTTTTTTAVPTSMPTSSPAVPGDPPPAVPLAGRPTFTG